MPEQPNHSSKNGQSDERLRLTNTLLNKMPFSSQRKRFHDTECKYLYVFVGARKKVFYVYKGQHGSVRLIKIGEFPQMTVEEARQTAVKKVAEISDDEPTIRSAKDFGMKTTLREMKDKYIADRQSAQKKMKDRSVQSIHYHIDRYLADWLDWPLKRITPDAVDKRFREMPQKTAANTTFRYLRAILNYANELAPYDRPVFVRNPVGVLSSRKIWSPPKARTRVLSEKEIGMFLNYFDDLFEKNIKARIPSRAVTPAFLLFVLTTGARKNEAMNLKFSDVKEGCVVFRVTKTEERTIPLHEKTLAIVEELKKVFGDKTDYVFPGDGKDGHLKEHKKPLLKFIKDCGVDTFSLHDLRRTFVTIGSQITSANNVEIIVGHKIPGVTGLHYYHPKIKDLKKSLDEIVNAYIAFAKAHRSPQIIGG